MFLSLSLHSRDKPHLCTNHPLRTLVPKCTILIPPCAKLDFAHARIKNHAINQALFTYKKIRFDRRGRTCIYPRVTSLRSGANFHTRIKSLSRPSIEIYYFDTPCIKYSFFARTCVVSKNSVRYS